MNDNGTIDAPGFNWSERDRACAAETLGRQGPDAADFLVLTDEEIVALDGLQHPQLVETPWLKEQPVGPESLVGVALRGLLARGLVVPHLDQPEITLSASPEITGALMLRRTAKTIVRVERQTNNGTAWLFAYCHVDSVLTEDIDPNGMHIFSVTDEQALLARLTGVANPFEITGSDGDPITMPESEFAVLTELPDPMAGTEAVTSVRSIHHDQHAGANFVVYAGRERVAVLTSTSSGAVTITEVTAARLATLLSSAVRRTHGLW